MAWRAFCLGTPEPSIAAVLTNLKSQTSQPSSNAANDPDSHHEPEVEEEEDDDWYDEDAEAVDDQDEAYVEDEADHEEAETKSQVSTSSNSGCKQSILPHLPSPNVLARMDAVAVETSLTTLIEYLVAEQQALSHGLNSSFIPAILDVNVFPLSPVLSSWLYALLAKLEKPLHSDLASTLRSLHRSCARLRALLPTSSDLADSKSSNSVHSTSSASSSSSSGQSRFNISPNVATCASRLNVIMTIVDRCFQQRS
jgi:hypothetical protein